MCIVVEIHFRWEILWTDMQQTLLFYQNSWFDLKIFILLLYEPDAFFKVWIHNTIIWHYFEPCIAVKHYYVYAVKHYYVYFLAIFQNFPIPIVLYMSLIIIDFILQSCWYYWVFLDFNIISMQDGLEQTFCSGFAIWEQIFIKDKKLAASMLSAS